MNLVGYVRVSSVRQADEGMGLDVQREGIVHYCEQFGHRLLGMHADEGVSGAKESAERPGLGTALLAVEDIAEALVVYRLDRLARHLVIQETIMERLSKLGKRVVSVAEPDIDDGDPTRILIRQVLGSISQYERSVITARMAAGKAAKAARGGYAYGAPPFGWRPEERELVADPNEQATIARIVGLRGEGRSLREICRILTTEAMPTKRGGRWSPKVVARILERVDAAKETEMASLVKDRSAEQARQEAAAARTDLTVVA